MKKHKTKIIVAIAIVALLAGAWFFGGTPNINPPEQPIFAAEAAPTEDENVAEPEIQEDTEYISEGPREPGYTPEAEYIAEPLPEVEIDPEPEPPYEPEIQVVEEPAHIPEEEPAPAPIVRDPVEPEDMVVGDKSFTVTLEVRVDMLVTNMHFLDRDKHELVPENGIIFPRTEVVAYEGESVFNVLQREMRRHRMHMAARFTPVFNSAYVEAINNLYEYDAGSLSGWVYSVNGWFPNFGSSRYLLSPGDEIEWHFTLDLGRDLGMDPDAGGQLDD